MKSLQVEKTLDSTYRCSANKLGGVHSIIIEETTHEVNKDILCEGISSGTNNIGVYGMKFEEPIYMLLKKNY